MRRNKEEEEELYLRLETRGGLVLTSFTEHTHELGLNIRALNVT